MKMRTLVTAIALAVALPGVIATTASAAERDFALRFSTTANGGIAYAGNTLATCRTADAGCSAAQQGAGPTLNNNDWVMTRVNVLSGDGAATAASAATLSLPDDARISFAGLYWSGRSAKGGEARWRATLIDPAGRRTPVVAGVRDEMSSSTYDAFADVTNLIDAGGAGSYTMSDVTIDVDAKDRFGGWALAVAYESRSQPARNLAIFDGARVVAAGSQSTINIPISGFLTPPTGAVNTELGFVAGEGDLASSGDYVKLNGTPMQNALNPANNVANSTVSRNGLEVTDRAPAYPNQLGWDVDTFNADGVLANNATSATITATTSGETYYPQVLSFATEVYAPEVTLDKAVTDLNGGNVERGDVLEYSIRATNTGSDTAVGATLRDPVPGTTDFVPGSITVNGAAQSDATGDDAGAFYAGSSEVLAALGTGGRIPGGGSLAPGASTTVTFRTTVRSSAASGEPIANRARADFNGATSGLQLGSESNLVTVGISAPDMAIEKTVVGVEQNGRATWTLRPHNVGGSALAGSVMVTDQLPAGLSGVKASGPGWTCQEVPGDRVICQGAGPVAPGASMPLITLTARASSAGRFLNVARVTAANDQNAENDYALTETVFDQPRTAVDFGTSVSVSDRRPVAGDRITATGVYTHYDGVPSTSRITLSLPSTITPRSAAVTGDAAGTCTIEGTTVTCDVGTLKEGQSVKVVVNALVSASVSGGTTIVSTIQPTGGDVDPAQANNTASVIVGVLPPQPVLEPATTLSLEKRVVSSVVAFDQPTTWEVKVTNTGEGTAANAYFQDQLPATATLVSAKDPQGHDCTLRGQVVRCDLGNLAPGQSAVSHITARYEVIGEITNGATAYADGGVRARGSASTEVHGSSVRARARTQACWINGRATMRLRITGGGPLIATGITITGIVPKGVRVVSARGFRKSVAANGTTTITRRTGNLKAGASREFLVPIQKAGTARVRLVQKSAATNADTASTAVRSPRECGGGRPPVTG